jgi:hypothetical protein
MKMADFKDEEGSLDITGIAIEIITLKQIADLIRALRQFYPLPASLDFLKTVGHWNIGKMKKTLDHHIAIKQTCQLQQREAHFMAVTNKISPVRGALHSPTKDQQPLQDVHGIDQASATSTHKASWSPKKKQRTVPQQSYVDYHKEQRDLEDIGARMGRLERMISAAEVTMQQQKNRLAAMKSDLLAASRTTINTGTSNGTAAVIASMIQTNSSSIMPRKQDSNLGRSQAPPSRKNGESPHSLGTPHAGRFMSQDNEHQASRSNRTSSQSGIT